jgi:integrase
MSKLAGKNVLITGASQGLGRELALRFAREGAAGLSLVARHADKLNAVRDDVRKIGPSRTGGSDKIDIVAIEADVSKPRDIERIVATTLAQFKGRLDVRQQIFNPDAHDSADFLEFLGLAGLGQAEASSLKRNDVDFDRDHIITFRHKTRTGFAIPIYPQVRPLLERLCSGLKLGERFFKIRDAKKALAGACKRLELPHFTQQSLRRMLSLAQSSLEWT